jgi:hypothetical protein
MQTLPLPEDPPTPAWLTAALHRAGVLAEGEVTALEQRTSDAFNSKTSYLHLHYSAHASPGAPTNVVLKRNGTEAWAIEAGAEEVKFYHKVAALRDHPPIIVPCYAAAYDEASGNSYLLLKDLSQTHAPPSRRDQQIGIDESVPPAAHIEAVIDTIASLHAYWWQHPLLETEIFATGYWSRNQDRFTQYLERRGRSWQSLLEHESSWFPDDLHTLYEAVFAHLPYHWERYLAPRFRPKTNLTLVHGDAYYAKFLCPKQQATGTTYLLDWQSPVFDLGGHDLANLIATFWTPAQRHAEARETRMLQRYHTIIRAHGVNGYSWEELVADYQAGLIYWLLVPLQDRFGGADRAYWWPKMQCLVAAFRDWHCEDLLAMPRR